MFRSQRNIGIRCRTNHNRVQHHRPATYVDQWWLYEPRCFGRRRLVKVVRLLGRRAGDQASHHPEKLVADCWNAGHVCCKRRTGNCYRLVDEVNYVTKIQVSSCPLLVILGQTLRPYVTPVALQVIGVALKCSTDTVPKAKICVATGGLTLTKNHSTTSCESHVYTCDNTCRDVVTSYFSHLANMCSHVITRYCMLIG